MGHETLAVSREGSVEVVTFARPHAMNALNNTMCKEIVAVCHDADLDDAVRVIVFTGQGKAFMAGADISEVQSLDPLGALEFMKRVIAITKAIEAIDKPTIAAINGVAFGGGNEIAMSCDIRIASREAKLGQQEINFGVAPGGGATQRLSRLVGYGRAMELILTGDAIDAQEAYRIGLINKVVDGGALMDECLKLANRLSGKSMAALAQAKAAVKVSRCVDLDSGLELEIRGSSLLWSTDSQKSLMKAFVDKQSKRG